MNPPLAVRPIEAGDRCALAAAFARLSPQSRLSRFLAPKPKLSARELSYLTDIDHVTHEALAAVDGQGHIVAVARYASWPSSSREAAEMAVAVVDSFQRRGIDSALAARVIERAEANGFARLTGSTFRDNVAARAMVGRLGFRSVGSGDGVVSYQLQLPAVARAT